MEFRRRLYKRGSSVETTIPMPLLLTMDAGEQHDVIFSYDQEKQAWFIQFEKRQEKNTHNKRSPSRERQQTSKNNSGDDS